jgi:hypothetical protein
LQVRDTEGWRWLVSSAVHRGREQLRHPCTRWAPAWRLTSWAFELAEKGSRTVLSIPITVGQACLLQPALTENNDSIENDDPVEGQDR